MNAYTFSITHITMPGVLPTIRVRRVAHKIPGSAEDIMYNTQLDVYYFRYSWVYESYSLHYAPHLPKETNIDEGTVIAVNDILYVCMDNTNYPIFVRLSDLRLN